MLHIKAAKVRLFHFRKKWVLVGERRLHHYLHHSVSWVLPVFYWCEQQCEWECVKLSGNTLDGHSHYISLPASVPFRYSGNLCSCLQGLADTTQQAVSRRGSTETEREKKVKKETERQKKERKAKRLGHRGWEREGIKRWEREEIVGGVIFYRSRKRTKAKKTRNEKKGWVSLCLKEKMATEEKQRRMDEMKGADGGERQGEI